MRLCIGRADMARILQVQTTTVGDILSGPPGWWNR